MGAALGGHIGVVRDLLEAGAEVDIADGEGGVALHFCSLAGAPAPALSAPVSHAHRAATPALPLAALAGHLEVTKLLLDARAEPNATTVDGRTAIAFAARGG